MARKNIMKGDSIMNGRKRMAITARRILMIGLSIVLLLSVFSIPMLAAEKVKLSYWVGGYPTEGINMIRQILAEFEEETGIEVELTTFPWGSYAKKLLTAFKMGEPPDVFVGNPRQYQRMGAVRAITEEFESLPYKDSYPEQFVFNATVDGDIWGLPHILTIWMIVINKEKFEQAGLDPERTPQNWEELLSMAKKLTRDTNNDGEIDQWGWGSHGGYLSSHIFLSLMHQQEIGLITGKRDELFIDQYRDEAIKTIEFMNELAEYTPGGPSAAAGYEYGHLMRMMAEEEIAMFFTTPFNGPKIVEMNPELEGKISFLNMPEEPTGFSMAGGGWIVTTADSKYPNESWELMEYLQKPENSLRSAPLTNYVPCRTDLLEHPLLKDNPWAKYMMRQAAQGVKLQEAHPGWGMLREKIMDAVAATFLGKKTVEQAVDDMIREMEVIQLDYELD
jgi:multiple sugar transport system substrate-binding protein